MERHRNDEKTHQLPQREFEGGGRARTRPSREAVGGGEGSGQCETSQRTRSQFRFALMLIIDYVITTVVCVEEILSQFLTT